MDIKGLTVGFVGSELWVRFGGQNFSPLSCALEQCSEFVLSSRCGLQDVMDLQAGVWRFFSKKDVCRFACVFIRVFYGAN